MSTNDYKWEQHMKYNLGMGESKQAFVTSKMLIRYLKTDI
jgi:hypothetical protein